VPVQYRRHLSGAPQPSIIPFSRLLPNLDLKFFRHILSFQRLCACPNDLPHSPALLLAETHILKDFLRFQSRAALTNPPDWRAMQDGGTHCGNYCADKNLHPMPYSAADCGRRAPLTAIIAGCLKGWLPGGGLSAPPARTLARLAHQDRRHHQREQVGQSWLPMVGRNELAAPEPFLGVYVCCKFRFSSFLFAASSVGLGKGS
jgi:hypothetical protein